MRSIYYLPFDDVVKIYDDMIRNYGGRYGTHDKRLIKAALARPKATFDGMDLYGTIFDKAAALFHSLLFKHAFVDANKRTTIAITARFLACNGFELETTQKKLVDFALLVENKHLPIEEIAEWLRKNSKKV